MHGLATVLVVAGAEKLDATSPVGAGAWVASSVEVGVALASGGELLEPREGPAVTGEDQATVSDAGEVSDASEGTKVLDVTEETTVSRPPAVPERRPPSKSKQTGPVRDQEGRPPSKSKQTGLVRDQGEGQSPVEPGETGGTERAQGDGVSVESPGLGGEQAAKRLGQLPAALTRALPAAARGDGRWHDLDSGRVGRWAVRAKLGSDGKLGTLEADAGAPAYVERLMRVSGLLLRGGRFALPASGTGEHELGLEVWVERGAAEGDGEPHLVRQLSSRYPEGQEPGEATVTFNSGLRVRLRVFVDTSR